MRYSAEYPEVNFFQSIGRLPHHPKFWYLANNGTISDLHPKKSPDIDQWRRGYWNAFNAGLLCKTSDWQHEKEYRLVLSSTLHDLAPNDLRKLRYNFSSLSGIVFGAETAAEDKLKVLDIVRGKCLEAKREDFEFYQASYSRKKRAFEIDRLPGLTQILHA
jgi:hypothetical protein